MIFATRNSNDTFFHLYVAERRASALQFVNGLKFPSSEYTASKGRGIRKFLFFPRHFLLSVNY